jgi:hypothetical protein
MTSKLALVVFIIVASTLNARATDLPEQRIACHQESPRHVPGRRGADTELFRRAVERRAQYVSTCMTHGLRDVEQTGSVSAPFPLKRPGVGK